MPYKVAILTNIPTPYRLPVFRRLSAAVDLQVIFDARSERNRSWALPEELGFPHIFVGGTAVPYWRKRPENGLRDERYLQLNYQVLPALLAFRPDVVVSAEMGLRSIQASFYSRLHKAPFILWWEGTEHTEGGVTRLKRWLRPRLVSCAARCWANGQESARLLQRYGMAEDRIDQGMIGADTSFFSRETGRCFAKRQETRQKLGLQGTAFLFIGQLVDRKGIDQYLRALERLKAETAGKLPFSVVFIGDGPKRTLLDNWQKSHPDVLVRLVGFQQMEALPRYLAACDVFVLPTLDDNWSLAALEAAVSGLPQIYSKYNGATCDLQAFGANGVRIDPYNTEEFAAALRHCIECGPGRNHSSVVGRLVDFFGPEQCTERALQSLETVLNTPSTCKIEAVR